MAPKPQAIEQKSQATPFTEKFMEQLMGNLSSGYATGLQRNAGTAIQQYTNSLVPYDMTDAFAGMKEMFGQMNREALGNLREQYSMGGGRYGSASALGTGGYLSKSVPQQQYLMGKLGLEGYNIFNNAKLGALGLQQQSANQALAPFLQFALAGNHPDQIFMTENPWMTGLKTVGGLAAGGGAALTGLADQGVQIFG